MKKFSHYLYQIIMPAKDNSRHIFNYPCYDNLGLHVIGYYVAKGATVRLIDVVYDEVENGEEN